MDSKRFKRKKYTPIHHETYKFPRIVNRKRYTGIYNGHCVSVYEESAIHAIYNEGNFGKGLLSKSRPIYGLTDDIPMLISQQQWKNQLQWKPTSEAEPESSETEHDKLYISSMQKFLESTLVPNNDSWKQWKAANLNNYETNLRPAGVSKLKEGSGFTDISSFDQKDYDKYLNPMVEEIIKTGKIKQPKDLSNKKVLVIETSDNMEINDDFDVSKINVKLKSTLHDIRETLNLNVSEAFFLCFAIGCLKIFDVYGYEMTIKDMWKKFGETEDNFITKYVAYHHYRAHGWTVRSGLKFGGDYLLYKIGPAYYHASYLVWLVENTKKKMTWNEFTALNRLVETCNKELLLCEVFQSDTETRISLDEPNVLRNFSILECVSKRWIPSQERCNKKPED